MTTISDVNDISYPSVTIVVLNWNNAFDTCQCLRSLQALTYENYHVLVVDNGSTDNSVLQIRDQFPTIDLIETGNNLGYAEGNNVGIKSALQSCPDYVCVLNNDTEIAPDFINQLVQEAVSDPSIAIVGPKMYCADPPDMIFAAGSLIEWASGSLNQRGMWRLDSTTEPLFAEKSEDVDFIVGCGFLIKRPVLEQIGLFDPRYYLNFEDVDLCTRAVKAGYRIRYTPNAVLFHKISASLGQGSPRNTYYMTRNALLFFGSHLHGWRRWRTMLTIVIRSLKHIAVWTLKPQYRQTARNKRDANVMALRDALLGRFGKMGSEVEVICNKV